MPPKRVEKTDANLLKMDTALQQLILDNGFIHDTSVETLVAAGVDSCELYYMLGNNESAAQAQTNLGRSSICSWVN